MKSAKWGRSNSRVVPKTGTKRRYKFCVYKVLPNRKIGPMLGELAADDFAQAVRDAELFFGPIIRDGFIIKSKS